MNRALVPTSLVAAALLVACGPAATTTPVTPSASVSITSPAVSSTATPSADANDVKIRAQIVAYSDFLNRAYADPSVSVNESARYLVNIAPDNVQSAVSKQILTFRADGYTETGNGTVAIELVTRSGKVYEARICNDSSAVVVKDSKGKKVDTGPAKSAAVYTMSKGVDGVWRIAKIQGAGTC